MGNVHMEATQINYRGGSKKMSVEEAIKAAGTEITPEEKAWIDTIPELASQEIIAPEFDAEEGVYAVGDLVIYQGGLYQFTTAHETAGAWNPEEVAAVKISDELDALRSGLTNVESNLDDVVVEYTGPAHSSDGRYYYFYFTSPFQSTCNRIFFDITYGSQHGYPKNAICMYSTDGSTTAWVNTDDTNITTALSDGELVITIDCGTSAWVIPVLRIKKKYGDLLTNR